MELNWTFILCGAAVIGAGAAIIPQIIKHRKISKADSPLILLADETEDNESIEDASILFRSYINDCRKRASQIIERTVDCQKAILTLKQSRNSIIECHLFRKLKSGKIIRTVITGDNDIHIDDCPQKVQEILLSGEYIIKL